MKKRTHKCPTCSSRVEHLLCAYCEKDAVVLCDCVTEVRTQRMIADINAEWKTCDKGLCDDHRTLVSTFFCLWTTLDLCPEHKDRVKPFQPLWIGDMDSKTRKQYEQSLLSQKRKVTNIMKTKITVTDEDIKKGRRANGASCPIARATRRAFNLKRGVEVGCTLIDVMRIKADFVAIPKKAVKFIWRFDLKKSVKPFSFYIITP